MPEGSHASLTPGSVGCPAPLATGAAAAGLWALLAAPPTGFGNLADELEAHAVALHARRPTPSSRSFRSCLRPARRRGARHQATRSLSPGWHDAIVVEKVAERGGRAETQLGMPLAAMIAHLVAVGSAPR